MNKKPPQLRGYEFLRRLGTGGTADVFLYRESASKRLVAVKVDQHRLDDVDAQHRFTTEMEAMSKLSTHPNVLTIYGAGVTADAHSYLIVEYAPGGSLKEAIARHPLDPKEVVSIGIAVCSALAAAHRSGILHCDLKPSNILRLSSGKPLVSDFGISKTFYTTDPVTSFSLPWAAPEIITGSSPNSESSDTYSLCATLFALLTGHSPYEYGRNLQSSEELTRTILSGKLIPVTRPDVPHAMIEILMKGVAPLPHDRFATAQELSSALHVLHKKISPPTPHSESLTSPPTVQIGVTALKRFTAITAASTALASLVTLCTLQVDAVMPYRGQTVHLPTISDTDAGLQNTTA